ncbi:hypothetical protein BGW36DRAFT_150528 [Talaromyces proteolyticus]|uniref:Uncharacterized protein n=1 Tax=Talaromyces proteolyticus TaxID=1131652 RepID=A0AAD4KT74_9EURO|nr:uncharacterized protein BGW36DRAFT_150528 [Talaromyces proteolyticus]KAH8698806.1 hypothetical protein BGW36DRAFT_150528 [Talaromyces proteolyticus]
MLLGEWVDQLFTKVFFQPDDDLSTKTMESHFSRDLKVRVNGVPLDYDKYKSAILNGRAQNLYSIQSNQELLSSHDGIETVGSGGSVAHISTYTEMDKKTRLEKQQSTVTLATVAVLDGKKVLIELVEVQRDA